MRVVAAMERDRPAPAAWEEVAAPREPRARRDAAERRAVPERRALLAPRWRGARCAARRPAMRRRKTAASPVTGTRFVARRARARPEPSPAPPPRAAAPASCAARRGTRQVARRPRAPRAPALPFRSARPRRSALRDCRARARFTRVVRRSATGARPSGAAPSRSAAGAPVAAAPPARDPAASAVDVSRRALARVARHLKDRASLRFL